MLPTALRSAQLLAATLTVSLAACGAAPEGTPGETPCTGKCDDPSAVGPLDVTKPGEAAVLRLHADAVRDGRLDAVEANRLAEFVKDAGGSNARIVAYLARLLAEDPRLTAEAAARLRLAIDPSLRVEIPLDNDVYRVVIGKSDFLEDDVLYLDGEGEVSAHTGLVSHSRGYAAKRDGVLFTRHGSRAPKHPKTTSAAESTRLRTQGPDAALDAAARIGGLEFSQFTSFGATARSSAYYAPGSDTPYWAGICQGWTHNALDDRLSVLVDPPGNTGSRGLWIFGEWVSRADLGNAMMGASFSLGIADSTTIDSFVSAEKLVKALAQHVLRTGRGLRVDIWNDSHNDNGHYDPQIWNQPIVAASVEVLGVDAAAQEAVLAHTRIKLPSLPADAKVKLVRATATWGAETNDAWEGDPAFRDSAWNLYMVVNAEGRVLRGYAAYELVEANVRNLPVTASDGLPDYIALPRHEMTDASFSGAPHRLLGTDNPEGARFRFVVGTVLAYGIPESTRTAFETEVLAGTAVDPDVIAARYPAIANAYSPAQWSAVFETILGPGAEFGARWAR